MIKSLLQLYASWPARTVAAIAVLLQIQITLGRTSDTLGISLNLADLTLPILGLVILYSLMRRGSHWPTWRLRFLDIGMGGVTVLFAVSALWAIHITGELHDWAFYNRLLGWGVMIAYFYAAAWLVTNYGPSLLITFFTTFVLFFLGSNGVFIASMAVQHMGLVDWGVRDDILHGLAHNRNLLGLFFLMALLGVGLLKITGALPKSTILWASLCALIPLFILYNGSRGFLIALPLVLAWVGYWGGRAVWITTARALGMGMILAALVVTLSSIGGKESILDPSYPRSILFTPETHTPDQWRPSDHVRAIVYQDAWELFLTHPVFGVGLGNSLTFQVQEHGRLIELIDSVPLWILAEFGLMGAIILGLLGLVVMVTLARGIDHPDPYHAAACRIGLALMVIFMILGLVYQIFFIRSFWFIMGLCCVRTSPVTARGPLTD